MVSLLKANFARLWKTKSFWICLALSAAVHAANFLSSYSVQPVACAERFGLMLFQGCMNTMLFTAIFAALFLGTDYSDGTVRNKLIKGHTRRDIYLSNLITTAAGGLLILAAGFAAVLTAGLVLGCGIEYETGRMLLLAAVSVCAVTAACSLLTLVGTLIASKSTITVITLVSTFALMIGAAGIMSALSEPEFIHGYMISENGDMELAGYEPNPAYIGEGLARDILTAVNDVLPSGQATQLESGEPHNAELMPLYSLGVLAAATAVGTLAFRRKDLK